MAMDTKMVTFEPMPAGGYVCGMASFCFVLMSAQHATTTSTVLRYVPLHWRSFRLFRVAGKGPNAPVLLTARSDGVLLVLNSAGQAHSAVQTGSHATARVPSLSTMGGRVVCRPLRSQSRV